MTLATAHGAAGAKGTATRCVEIGNDLCEQQRHGLSRRRPLDQIHPPTLPFGIALLAKLIDKPLGVPRWSLHIWGRARRQRGAAAPLWVSHALALSTQVTYSSRSSRIFGKDCEYLSANLGLRFVPLSSAAPNE